MMSNNKLIGMLLILVITVLTACNPAGTQPGAEDAAATATPGTLPTLEADSATDAVTAAAVAHLAGELGVPEAEIEVISAEMTEFTDSCLGLGGPAESCLQAITPGWRITLSAGGQEYEVRADETGGQVRVAPEAPAEAADPDAAIAAAVALLASELGVPESDIEMVSLEAAEFTDSCLGLGGPAESCLQAMTPGWLITLSAGGQQHEARADATGQEVRLAVEAPAGDGSDTAAAAAQEYLANQLGVALGDVQVISTEHVEFSDGCLGLGRPDESCLQAITPGWLVMLDVAGNQYEAHTDETGQQVRVAGLAE